MDHVASTALRGLSNSEDHWRLVTPEIAVEAAAHPVSSESPDRYIFAEGALTVDSEDRALRDRFRQLYPEGRLSDGAGRPQLGIACRVRRFGERVVIRFDDPEPLDALAFCLDLFQDRNIREGAEQLGWRTLCLEGERPLIAFKDDLAIADAAGPWQPIVANLAVNRLLRLQRRLLFFHAGGLCVGTRGVLIAGPKNAGKTTTGLALAARGHGFLGDEIAAVRKADGAMLPIRRTAAVRAGVRSAEITRRLDDACHREIFPNGEERMRVAVGRVLPEAAARPARLSTAIFLRSKGPRPQAERFDFGLRHCGLLTPLPCCFWGAPPGRLMIDLARLMRPVHCYFVDIGMPEPTADLIEHLAGDAGR